MNLSPSFISKDPSNTLSPSRKSTFEKLLTEDMISYIKVNNVNLINGDDSSVKFPNNNLIGPNTPNKNLNDVTDPDKSIQKVQEDYSLKSEEIWPNYSPKFEENSGSEYEKYKPELFCVRWTPPIDKFFKFTTKLRKYSKINLGGTRKTQHNYQDKTIAAVMSVGKDDARTNLPQRVTLSNFKLGSPITSYGCICRYWNPELKESEYLLIRRKNSVSYIELIHGAYRQGQLFFIIQDLPDFERKLLIEHDFDTLWEDLHLKSPAGDSYEYGKKVFLKIKPHLKTLFEKFPSRDPDGKYFWLFPKGKPDYNPISYYKDSSTLTNLSEQKIGSNELTDRFIPESPFECALREFSEETNGINLSSEDIRINHPIVEKYLGSNSKNYQTNYFVFEISEKWSLNQFPKAKSPIREVSLGEVDTIQWAPYSQTDKYLCPARKKLLNYIEENISSIPKPDSVNIIWKYPAELSEIPIE